ncbi:PH domain-containing protein [Nocardiopsis metallicus]|uniref:Putative membrane protein n=1 Tax=Nocardiopsis metallicus TaxID=179819 RepID=A0A840WM42_9ACTN|nr:PH domain-containing protein [Nocardiopsis metallicus]MBB5491178.1 putative membrane protein [Nocardiopsis metallicus]
MDRYHGQPEPDPDPYGSDPDPYGSDPDPVGPAPADPADPAGPAEPEPGGAGAGAGGWVAPGSTSSTAAAPEPGPGAAPAPGAAPWSPPGAGTVPGATHGDPPGGHAYPGHPHPEHAGPPAAQGPTFTEGPHAYGGQPRSWWGETPGEPVPGFGAESARQLSPRSMVVGPINQLKSLLLPVLAGLVIGGFNPWLLTATGMGVIALLVGGLVTWKTFRYEVGEDRIEIRKGLIRRSRRTIPLERVRGVDVTSTLLHRMLGVAVVRIEAAAGSVGDTEDGKLDAVSTQEAERLRRVLLHRKAVLTEKEAGEAEATPEAPGGEGENGVPAAAHTPLDADVADDTVTHFTMPRSWYLYGALSLGYLLTPFVVLATLFGMVQQSAGQLATDYFVDWVTSTDRAFLMVFGTAAVGVLVLLMPVFAVASYALTHWGFSLKERDGSLVAERGLFTRRSVTLEKRRIRGYELLDSPLERTRGAVGLRAIVTGLGDAATRAVLLPVGPRSRVEPVLDRALALFRAPLTRHPRAALYRRLTRAVLPFAVVAAAAAALDITWLVVTAAVLALLGVPLGIDRYRSLGHGYDGEHVSVRSGSLSRSQATVERSAVIGWTWTQTLFQRRSRLADLQVTVGAGTGGYTAQDAALDESVAFAARITPEMVRPFLAQPEDEPRPSGQRASSRGPSTRDPGGQGENGPGHRE